MKKLLIFCLMFWSVASFGQSAMFGVLKNGDGVYYGRNHLADGKYLVDTAGTKYLFNDLYYLGGSVNSIGATWRIDANGITLNVILSGHAIAATVGGPTPPSGNTFGSTLTVPSYSAYLNGVDVLLNSPFTSKASVIVSTPDSVVMGVISSINNLVNVYEKIDINRVTLTTRLFDTAGYPSSRLALLQSSGSTGGQVASIANIMNQTTANTTGTTQSLMNIIKLSHAAGTALNTQVVTANLYMSGAGNATTIRGFQSNIIHQSTGTLTEVEGIYDQGVVLQSTGVVTDYYGLRLGASNAGTGTITRRWGVYQEDALAVNRFDGKMLLNNVFTGTGTPTVLVHLTDSTVGQMAFPGAASGSFTPAFTNTTNISSSGLYTAVYTQTGTIVTATISGHITATSANANTILTIALPVSTVTNTQEGIGPAAMVLFTGGHGSITGYISGYAKVSNTTTMQVAFWPTNTNDNDFSVTIQYHTN